MYSIEYDLEGQTESGKFNRISVDTNTSNWTGNHSCEALDGGLFNLERNIIE
jgi:hypothetical protein